MYEIYYKNTDNRPIEYIEIYNGHSNTINLANWTISGAIRYEFPPNTFIAPNEYLIITQDDRFWFRHQAPRPRPTA